MLPRVVHAVPNHARLPQSESVLRPSGRPSRLLRALLTSRLRARCNRSTASEPSHLRDGSRTRHSINKLRRLEVPPASPRRRGGPRPPRPAVFSRVAALARLRRRLSAGVSSAKPSPCIGGRPVWKSNLSLRVSASTLLVDFHALDVRCCTKQSGRGLRLQGGNITSPTSTAPSEPSLLHLCGNQTSGAPRIDATLSP